MEVGCGTAVVGDGALDANIPKDVFSHPLSTDYLNYQWPTGRTNLNSNPIDPGYYPARSGTV